MGKMLLFAGKNYYPLGGVDDFCLRGSLIECMAWFEEFGPSRIGGSRDDLWAQIVSEDTMRLEWEGDFVNRHPDGRRIGPSASAVWRQAEPDWSPRGLQEVE